MTNNKFSESETLDLLRNLHLTEAQLSAAIDAVGCDATLIENFVNRRESNFFVAAPSIAEPPAYKVPNLIFGDKQPVYSEGVGESFEPLFGKAS